MLTHAHHFGITVSHGPDSNMFYTRVLRLPYMATSVNRGRKHDTMYHLTGSENQVSWYQLGQEGTELFYLPTHPAKINDSAPLARPGWRYAAFDVRHFDDYVQRLEDKGANPRITDSAHGRCARVQDPDGVNLLFFESNDDSGGPLPMPEFGRIIRIREAGLVAASLEGYDEFFHAVGLARNTADPGPDFLAPLFDYDKKIESAVYGRIRLLHLPQESLESGERLFPYQDRVDADDILDYYPDTGIKHICYYVEDISEFYARAKKRGVYFLFEPTPIGGGSRIVYFSDPEGHVIEVFQMRPALKKLAALAGNIRQAQMDLFSAAARRLR